MTDHADAQERVDGVAPITALRDPPLHFKDSFAEHYKELLGADYERFVDAVQHYLPKAIRCNPLKQDPKETAARLRAYFVLVPVPWCPDAYWLRGERRDAGNTVEHQLGYCYVQEAASMIPPVVLAPKRSERVLDIAASPGSKTTQLSAMMENTGVIIANDRGMRLRPLGINVQKCGCRNVIVTNMDGRALKRLRVDAALADVPCSATGTLQRSPKAALLWRERALASLQQLQYQLALAAYTALRPGGRMVYSTCTLEPLENEGVVTRLIQNGARVLPIKLPLKREQPFAAYRGVAFHPDVRHALRIHPYTNGTEGFFVCLLEKPQLTGIQE